MNRGRSCPQSECQFNCKHRKRANARLSKPCTSCRNAELKGRTTPSFSELRPRHHQSAFVAKKRCQLPSMRRRIKPTSAVLLPAHERFPLSQTRREEAEVRMRVSIASNRRVSSRTLRFERPSVRVIALTVYYAQIKGPLLKSLAPLVADVKKGCAVVSERFAGLGSSADLHLAVHSGHLLFR